MEKPLSPGRQKDLESRPVRVDLDPPGRGIGLETEDLPQQKRPFSPGGQGDHSGLRLHTLAPVYAYGHFGGFRGGVHQRQTDVLVAGEFEDRKGNLHDKSEEQYAHVI